MKDNGPLIKVCNLKKYFPITAGVFRRAVGWVKAVDNISFEIHEGQTVALAGESGCGKTTTAKALLLLEEPTAGQILWQGRDIWQLDYAGRKAYRKTVQAVFQDPTSSLNPRMRVKDIVCEPLVVNERISKTEVEERVAELLFKVGLQPEDANLYS
jgi:ABC-type oligopeptide transport system ATPase subunit